MADATTPGASKALTAARQMWPEDAFAAWKREHYDQECPDDDPDHCAFMSGIAYAEEHLIADVKRLDWICEVAKADGEFAKQIDAINAESEKDGVRWLCIAVPYQTSTKAKDMRDAIDRARGASSSVGDANENQPAHPVIQKESSSL